MWCVIFWVQNPGEPLCSQQFQSLCGKLSMLRFTLFVTLAIAAAATAEDCVTDEGQRCMSKCEVSV